MRYLVIYDEQGFVISVTGGTPEPREPIGVPFLWVDIPQGKTIKITNGIGVDVSVTPHRVIFEDVPKSEMELLQEQLEQTQIALAELAEATLGGIE